MALQNAKFFYNLLSQELRVRSEMKSSRLCFASKSGKDPCKPQDPCPKKKDKCQKEDSSKQTDPCGPKRKSPSKDPCHPKKASESKKPWTLRIPAGSFVCPPPYCPSSYCAEPSTCPGAGGKLLCSSVVNSKMAIIGGGVYGVGYILQ